MTTIDIDFREYCIDFCEYSLHIFFMIWLGDIILSYYVFQKIFSFIIDFFNNFIFVLFFMGIDSMLFVTVEVIDY